VSHKISPLCEQAQLFFLYQTIPQFDRVQTRAVRFLSATRLKTVSVAGLHRMRCEACLDSVSVRPLSEIRRFRSHHAFDPGTQHNKQNDRPAPIRIER